MLLVSWCLSGTRVKNAMIVRGKSEPSGFLTSDPVVDPILVKWIHLHSQGHLLHQTSIHYSHNHLLEPRASLPSVACTTLGQTMKVHLASLVCPCCEGLSIIG